MNKRGVSTVEMIVSFTIFLSFVLFIFLYLNPLKSDISQSLLVSLESGLKEHAMTDLREWPVAVNKSSAPDCLDIEIPFNSTEVNIGNISVKDLNDDTLEYKLVGDHLYIKKINDKLYRIIQSDEIERTDTLKSACDVPTIPPQYEFSVERIDRIYSYKRLLEINMTYYADYKQAKQGLNYPSNSDFAVIITSNEFNITMTRSIPPNIQLRARTLPIEILKNDNRIRAFMSMYVW